MVSTFGCVNGLILAGARVSYAMARNGNAPQKLAKTTDRGVPFVSLVVTFVVGLIVFLPFPSWQQLVGFITSATVLSFASGPAALATVNHIPNLFSAEVDGPVSGVSQIDSASVMR